jgi:UDPglucose 6-dehydrogenase
VLPLVGKGKTALIKSTILPGTTESIQKQFPNVFVFHSPEFLTEATAAHDAAHPDRNIVGISVNTHEARAKAQEVLDVLPPAPFSTICSSREAEMVKYAGNCWFYTKVIFVNLLYDLAQELGCSWDVIRDAMAADPRIGRTHLDPVHKSGRGAGGHCFIKDFAAFEEIYKKLIDDPRGNAVIDSLREKNIELLLGSNKDLDLLRETYGERISAQNKREEKDMLYTA